MGSKFKALLRVMLSASIGLLIAFIAQHNIKESYKAPTHEQLMQLNNNSQHVLISQQKKIIKRSRSSALRVLSLSIENGSVASSSGTYITMFEHFYVITTNHGILGSCENTKIIADEIAYNCLRFIELNDEVDYALIEIDKVEHRAPVKIPQNLIRTNRQWKDALSIMSKTFYTGFPNGLGPLTIDGKIMGHSPDGFIYMNSYAWSGSSGSGVFSKRGDYLGYVIAIDVGSGFNGSTVLENVVLVVPAYKINWATAIDFLEKPLPRDDTANYKDTNSEE